MSKTAFFEGVGHFERKFQTEEASPTNHCGCQKSRVTALSCGIRSELFGSVTKHACDRRTDRQTDRQNYDSQDRVSIASRDNKMIKNEIIK